MKPISAIMPICSSLGSLPAAAEGVDAGMGSSMSSTVSYWYRAHTKTMTVVKQLKSTHTGVFHVLKEPAHGDFCSVVASCQQSLLTADSGEAHRFELGDRGGVDFGSRGC